MKQIFMFFLLIASLSSFSLRADTGTGMDKPVKKVIRPEPANDKTNEAVCDADVDRVGCQNEELKREDAKLNLAYQQLIKSISLPSKQAKLRETERLWLQFVEKNCHFEASTFSGGTLEPITYTDCVIRHTKARTAELADQYDECNSYGAC